MPDPFLVAWYRFEADAPYEDSSGNEHHGTCEAGLTCPTLEMGPLGTGARFDGNDDVVTVPYSPEFDFLAGFTISAWVDIDALDPPGVAVSRAYGSSDQYSYAVWHDVGGDAYFGTWDSSRDMLSWLVVARAFREVAWTHVAAVWTGDSKCLYIDGALRRCSAANATLYADNELDIGAGPTRGGSSRYHFDGVIDDVRLYRRVLREDEIAALATP